MQPNTQFEIQDATVVVGYTKVEGKKLFYIETEDEEIGLYMTREQMRMLAATINVLSYTDLNDE
jgi:hypothetical protein